jgi:ribosomal protein S27AE
VKQSSTMPAKLLCLEFWRGSLHNIYHLTATMFATRLTVMNQVKCSRCGTIMGDYGIQRPGIGEVTGEGSPHVLGDMEGKSLPVQTHICPKCGNLEFTATEQATARLLSRKGLKKCVKCGKSIPLASEECPHFGTKQPSS